MNVCVCGGGGGGGSGEPAGFRLRTVAEPNLLDPDSDPGVFSESGSVSRPIRFDKNLKLNDFIPKV